MFKVYDQWPSMAEAAYLENYSPIEFSGINQIIFAGMGGSGTLGDFFAAILSKSSIHVSVVKGYEIPKNIDSKTLLVVTSVSGNTIETLTVLKSTIKKKCKIITFSSGGKMEEISKENNLIHFKIPKTHSPRASFPTFLYTMLKIFEPILPIKENDIKESISEIYKIKDKISSSNLTETNPSIKLAKWIKSIPLIYYPWGLESAAIRFKNSLQENCKIHVIVENVIESGHNGIISWEKKSNVEPILLLGQDDHYKTKERWQILKKYFKENEIDFEEIISLNGNIITKLINLIYLLDYATIYLAVFSNIDPTPIKSIDYIKKLMIKKDH
jgi:glucose/mannose-6-phosphate isomerase